MKISVNPDGTYELDVQEGDGQAALDMLDTLAARAQAREKQAAGVVNERIEAMLNRHQHETLEALRVFDNPNGVHIDTIAQSLGLTTSAVSQRMIILVRHGLVNRIRRGYYRAVKL